MTRRRKERLPIIWRDQGGRPRAYFDGRRFGDRVRPLVAPDEKRATTDPTIAEALATKRLAELQRGQLRAVHGLPPETMLATFAEQHLLAKAKAGRVTDGTLEADEHCLDRAVAFLGKDRELSTITAADVRAWDEHLQSLPGRRGEQLSGGARRHHLNALSNLFRRAQSEGRVAPGFNPVAALLEKPSARRAEAKWLEVHDGALLLEAARLYRPKRDDCAVPFAYPLLATFLLTGGRRAEVLGLEVDDVSFDRKTVTFRPNGWRRLKTATSFRSVPLWPQLEAILRTYLFGGDRPPARLLFPSTATGEERMLVELRKVLDAVATRAGWKPGELRSKMFRHTYCAARLQTLDGGAPVSVYTVSRELGHGGDSLVKRVYGHLGTVRHRAEVVEYCVEQHAEKLGERLAALSARA